MISFGGEVTLVKVLQYLRFILEDWLQGFEFQKGRTKKVTVADRQSIRLIRLRVDLLPQRDDDFDILDKNSHSFLLLKRSILIHSLRDLLLQIFRREFKQKKME